LWGDLRELDAVGGITCDESVVDGGIQHRPKDDDGLAHSTCGQALGKHRRDPLLDIREAELGEPAFSEGREDAAPKERLVAGLDLGLHAQSGRPLLGPFVECDLSGPRIDVVAAQDVGLDRGGELLRLSTFHEIVHRRRSGE
jgi:hypothetical protein